MLYFLVAILDAILNILILQLAKYISFVSPLASLQGLIKMQTNIQTNIHFQISEIHPIAGNLYLVDILDAFLNFLQGSMMSRVHFLDSIMSVG